MLVRKPDNPDLVDLAREAKAHYEAELAVYRSKTAQQAIAAAPTTSGDSDAETPLAVVPTAKSAHELDPPFPPNDLVPYCANVIGLDKACKDCRFEMIKIVREVGGRRVPRSAYD